MDRTRCPRRAKPSPGSPVRGSGIRRWSDDHVVFKRRFRHRTYVDDLRRDPSTLGTDPVRSVRTRSFHTRPFRTRPVRTRSFHTRTFRTCPTWCRSRRTRAGRDPAGESKTSSGRVGVGHGRDPGGRVSPLPTGHLPHGAGVRSRRRRDVRTGGTSAGSTTLT